MYQLEKMPLTWFLLNILKPNFATYDWFWADAPQMSIYNVYVNYICKLKDIVKLYVLKTRHNPFSESRCC